MRSSGRGPSQARDSPGLTLPSGPRRTPGGGPPPRLLVAPPACAAAEKAPSLVQGRVPRHAPPSTDPRPRVTSSLQILPHSQVTPLPFLPPSPPHHLPIPHPFAVWDSRLSEIAPPSRTKPPLQPRAAPSLPSSSHPPGPGPGPAFSTVPYSPFSLLARLLDLERLCFLSPPPNLA